MTDRSDGQIGTGHDIAEANLLWLRFLRAEAESVRLTRYVCTTGPIALPPSAAAVAVLALERVVTG